MKKSILKVLLAFTLLFGFSQVSNAQHVFVKVRPRAEVVVRPAAPSSRHVWIEGEWTWNGTAYVHGQGRWVIPEPHREWVAGHWRRAYGGWNWVPGHWRRI